VLCTVDHFYTLGYGMSHVLEDVIIYIYTHSTCQIVGYREKSQENREENPGFNTFQQKIFIIGAFFCA
jgi:hypothetical protein